MHTVLIVIILALLTSPPAGSSGTLRTRTRTKTTKHLLVSPVRLEARQHGRLEHGRQG